jgi:LPS sulfotransferase NodH
LSAFLSRFLPSGSTRPRRFIILGHARSGSNLVAYSLDAHRQVAMLSEVLSDIADVRDRCRRSARHAAFYNLDEDGARFLDNKVFLHRAPLGIRACGFKIFYDHARFSPAVKTAWDYLVADPEIQVVHLKRRNLLHAKVSLDVALVTNQWTLERNVEQKLVPAFRADPVDYKYFFYRFHSYREWATNAFSRHRVLELDYERHLCADFPGSVARLCDFLGLAPGTASPPLRKQASLPPSQQLLNYEELRAFFRHSLYEHYFDDGETAG